MSLVSSVSLFCCCWCCGGVIKTQETIKGAFTVSLFKRDFHFVASLPAADSFNCCVYCLLPLCAWSLLLCLMYCLSVFACFCFRCYLSFFVFVCVSFPLVYCFFRLCLFVSFSDVSFVCLCLFPSLMYCLRVFVCFCVLYCLLVFTSFVFAFFIFPA